jgi:hypothetical protein
MSFTINCNSNNVFDGIDPSELTYSFDFSVFEDCPYKVHWKLISEPIIVVDETLFVLSITGLGVNLNSYTASSSTTAQSSSVVGLLSPYYIMDTTAITPVNFSYLKGGGFFFINNRPRSSSFTVRIKDQIDVSLSDPTGYCLCLTFEKI